MVAKALSEEITATCGYAVRVEAKPMEHKRPQVTPYVWPIRRMGSTKGGPYVTVTPTGLEGTIRQSFEDVWNGRVASSSASQDIIILSDHDTPTETLRARASRACSFEIQDPEQQTAWDNPVMREIRLIAERGQVWAGRSRGREATGLADLGEHERFLATGSSIGSCSEVSTATSETSEDAEDVDDGLRALSSPSGCSDHALLDDTRTISAPTSTPETPSLCSTPYGEAVGTPNVTRDENDVDDVELYACANARVNISPMSRSITRPPPPTSSPASPVPLSFHLGVPHSPPTALPIRPLPTHAPPPVPMADPNGFWRVGGYTARGSEILTYHPHTHTPITKPRTKRFEPAMRPFVHDLSTKVTAEIHRPKADTHACLDAHAMPQHCNPNRPKAHTQPPEPPTSTTSRDSFWTFAATHTVRNDESNATPPTSRESMDGMKLSRLNQPPCPSHSPAGCS